jgi:TPR repeat protein
VPPDLVEAYKWLAIAAAHGQPKAAAFLPVLEKKLTPEQKTQALDRAKGLLLK